MVLLLNKQMRLTEYCSELYNYESCGDNAVLDCSQPQEEDLQPILREKVEIAVKVKVSHSLIAVGAVGVRVPLYLGHS